MHLTKTIFFCMMICGGIALILAHKANAQDSLQQKMVKGNLLLKKDSIEIKKDSVPKEGNIITANKDTGLNRAQEPYSISFDSLRKIHSARRAAFYSAVFPGLGQIYNHQYIKVPLMLGGMGVATGVFLFNFNKYITYRNAYRLRLNGHLTGNAQVDIYTPSDLQFLRDGYRQYVDYSVLGFAAVYLYNILDAIVFAHLYHFDVSNDLGKVRFGPVINQYHPEAGYGFSCAGLGISYHF